MAAVLAEHSAFGQAAHFNLRGADGFFAVNSQSHNRAAAVDRQPGQVLADQHRVHQRERVGGQAPSLSISLSLTILRELATRASVWPCVTAKLTGGLAAV